MQPTEHHQPNNALTFGKVKAYDCACGGTVVRALHGDQRPCDRCGRPLGTPRIEDHKLLIAAIVEAAIARAQRE